jgi:hypothetical protein
MSIVVAEKLREEKAWARHGMVYRISGIPVSPNLGCVIVAEVSGSKHYVWVAYGWGCAITAMAFVFGTMIPTIPCHLAVGKWQPRTVTPKYAPPAKHVAFSADGNFAIAVEQLPVLESCCLYYNVSERSALFSCIRAHRINTIARY